MGPGGEGRAVRSKVMPSTNRAICPARFRAHPAGAGFPRQSPISLEETVKRLVELIGIEPTTS